MDGHDDDHQEHLPSARPLHGLEDDLLFAFVVEEALGGQDEEDAQECAQHGLRPAVAGALRHEPEAGAQHEPRRDGVGVRHHPVRESADEQERKGAEPRRHRRDGGVEEDQVDVAHGASPVRATTIPMATMVTSAMLVRPACRYDSGSSSTSSR